MAATPIDRLLHHCLTANTDWSLPDIQGNSYRMRHYSKYLTGASRCFGARIPLPSIPRTEEKGGPHELRLVTLAGCQIFVRR
jgi:hypothetical protein